MKYTHALCNAFDSEVCEYHFFISVSVSVHRPIHVIRISGPAHGYCSHRLPWSEDFHCARKTENKCSSFIFFHFQFISFSFSFNSANCKIDFCSCLRNFRSSRLRRNCREHLRGCLNAFRQTTSREILSCSRHSRVLLSKVQTRCRIR